MIGPVVFGRLNGATGAGNRIYPLVLPQESPDSEEPYYPAVTYTLVSAPRFHGFGQDMPGTVARVQIDVWAESYGDARALAGEVTGRLSRWRGTVNGRDVRDITLDTEQDLTEAGLFRVSLDFKFHL